VSIGGDNTNSNFVSVDADWGNGGSAVTFGGVLTNTGAFAIGNSGLSAPTKVTAAALVNTGSLSVQGNTQNGTMNKASLIVSGAAPTTLTGSVQVSGDATLQFGSGAITAIDTGASLELDGAGAQILTDGGASSALSGLAANDGTLRLSGKTLTTTSSFVNSNVVSVDTRSFDGGADLTFGGALTNPGWFAVGNQFLSAPTTVRATALVNSGRLIVQGNYQAGTAGHASVILSGTAPSTLTGYDSVSVDGDATLQFGSGAITAIGAGASLEAKYGAQILTDGGARLGAIGTRHECRDAGAARQS
jgi:hypothetical protein